MAKSLLAQILFVSVVALGPSFKGRCNPISTSTTPPSADICEAPAPDSFRVENAGPNFVTLAWLPAWSGAEHTLKVYKHNEDLNAWDLLDTINNVLGPFFTVNSLEYGSKYRFVIATNCTSGETSALSSSVDHINLILDLTVAGLSPIDAIPVPGLCPSINYQGYNWVGFVIKKFSEFRPKFTYYEFREGVDPDGLIYPVIMRVQDQGPVMALGKHNGWGSYIFPTSPNQPLVRIVGGNTFLVRHYLNAVEYVTVGNVAVQLSESPKLVSFCPEPGWNSDYQLIPLIVQLTNAPAPNTEYRAVDDNLKLAAKAQSPFDDFIQIFLPSKSSNDEQIIIEITSLEGISILRQKHENYPETILMPVHFLPKGVYLIRIETSGSVQTIKVIKP